MLNLGKLAIFIICVGFLLNSIVAEAASKSKPSEEATTEEVKSKDEDTKEISSTDNKQNNTGKEESSPKEEVKKEIVVPEKISRSVEKSFLDSSIVKKIHKRQARRRNALNALKLKGVVGEAENGTIMIRDITVIKKKKSQEKIEKLVKVENNDRELVIKEMVKVNKFKAKDEVLLRLKLFEGYLKYDGKGTYHFRNNRWQQKE